MSTRGPAWDRAVLTAVAAAGLAVFAAGAWASAVAEPPEDDADAKPAAAAADAELLLAGGDAELPALPQSAEDAAVLYRKARAPLAKIFRIVGNTFVAPIAYGVSERLYTMYCEGEFAELVKF